MATVVRPWGEGGSDVCFAPDGGRYRLDAVQVVDVRGEGDPIAAVHGDMIPDVRGVRREGGCTLPLAHQPALDLDDLVGEYHFEHTDGGYDVPGPGPTFQGGAGC